MKNYYKILEVSPECSMEEIDQAFQIKAKETHPVHSGINSTGLFIQVNEAFAVLSSKESRLAYNKLYTHYFVKPTLNNKEIVDTYQKIKPNKERGIKKGKKHSNSSYSNFEKLVDKFYQIGDSGSIISDILDIF